MITLLPGPSYALARGRAREAVRVLRSTHVTVPDQQAGLRPPMRCGVGSPSARFEVMELVEREGVLTELDAMLGEVAQGNGRLALVSGEAGIGKTAVVERFYRSRSDGVRVLAGGCDPLATPRPLGPLADIATAVGGELDRLLDEGTDPTRLFHTFVRVLSGSGRPTVVVFEDMHWADQATLDLLCFLGRRVAQTRALVVVTFRDDELEADHPLRVAVGNMPVAPVVRRLPLEPLSDRGVAAVAGGRRLDYDRLYRLSGGNPFFLTELLATEDGELPETVRDAVLARASRLSEAGRADLDVLAAVGRPIGRPLLAEVGIASAHVDEGVSRGLLRWDERRVRFRHELARTAILEAIPPARAEAIHRRILAALLKSRVDGDAAELAYHAEEAGDAAAVLEHAPAAALKAERLSAHREAAAQWARALRFADSSPAEERAALYEGCAREAFLSADVTLAVEAARAALDLRRGLGDPLATGSALAQLAVLVWHTEEAASAKPQAREAIALLEELPPSVELAAAYSALASLHVQAAEMPEAVSAAERALDLAEDLGLLDIRIQALGTIGAAKLCGPNEDGWPDLERALAEALSAGLPAQAGRAYGRLVWFGAMHRQFDYFDRYFEEALGFCGRHDLGEIRLGLRQSRTVELVHRGRWTEGGELAQELLAEPGIALVDRIQPLYVLGRLRARRGDPQVWAALDEALGLAAPRNELAHVGNVRAVRAEACWLEGDLEQMVVEARAAYPLAVPVRDPWILGELAVWLWRGGALQEMDPVLEEHPYGLQIQGDWEAAAGAWERLGCPFEQAAALVDSDDEAALRRALQIFDGLGARPAEAMAARRLRTLGVRGIPRGAQRATRANPHNLTRRQQEVLTLLDEGLSDAEIADRLFLSTKTVNHHVSAVLTKLGVRSRVEAIAREK